MSQSREAELPWRPKWRWIETVLISFPAHGDCWLLELHRSRRTTTQIERKNVTELECVDQALQYRIILIDVLLQLLLALLFLFTETLDFRRAFLISAERQSFEVSAYDISPNGSEFSGRLD